MDNPIVVPLWPEDEFPTGSPPPEITCLQDGLKVLRNVSRPTLSVHLADPSLATGSAVVVCPGGAYHFLAIEHEGAQVARWLNARGIAVFILHYRLIPTGDGFPQSVFDTMADREKMNALVAAHAPLVTADGLQALRMVRAGAAGWGLDAQKIGILGFSAGGMVTLSAALHYDESSRPNFAAPIYAAPPPDAPVPTDAPPLFLLCAADDDMASAVSTRFYTQWRSAGRPVELHIYAQGGHGFGMNSQELPCDRWIERFADWLQAQGF